MGCYMSTPDNRVFVTEGQCDRFKFATASCQGWRREQEDAEDCIPNFDDDGASLFILCDGHGGAEVAKYTVEHLPNFIKNHPLYKEGKWEEALYQSFIDFDALLRTPEVMDTLHKIAFDEAEQNKAYRKAKHMMELNETPSPDKPSATDTSQPDEAEPSTSAAELPSSSAAGSSGASSLEAASSAAGSSGSNGPMTVVDDVDTETLRKEAQVPLKQIIEQYSANASAIDPATRQSLLSKFNSSPVIRPKRDDDEDEAEATSSTTPGASTSKSDNDEDSEEKRKILKESLIKQILQRYFPEDDSSDDSEFDGKESSNDEDGDDEGDDDCAESSTKKLRRKKHKRPTNRDEATSSDDDDEDEDDTDYDEESNYDDDEDEDEDEGEDEEGLEAEGEDEQDEDEQENEDEDDDEEIDEEKADDSFFDGNEDDEKAYTLEELTSLTKGGSRAHTPGLDSGCTTVVALIKNGYIYVASAGDSRCILVYRNGQCRPMSFDHKPEDSIERTRIYKAGGRVTDGRVNGGLNLSRALGDFTYKSEQLEAKDQMITPCPVTKSCPLDIKQIEYVFLACDGIWNSMKNQQVARFIKNNATADNDLVDICVKLFRKCIAPRTDGDGTGCDNMTCIIARFPSDEESLTEETKKISQAADGDLKDNEEAMDVKQQSQSKQKRSTDTEGDDESSDVPSKKRCIRL